MVERGALTICEIERRPRSPFRLFNGGMNENAKQICKRSSADFRGGRLESAGTIQGNVRPLRISVRVLEENGFAVRAT
jgi:hypothetical protein